MVVCPVAASPNVTGLSETDCAEYAYEPSRPAPTEPPSWIPAADTTWAPTISSGAGRAPVSILTPTGARGAWTPGSTGNGMMSVAPRSVTSAPDGTTVVVAPAGALIPN